ncbi:MAG TPA: decarboxylating 6-phosphogluconate dehydrogenase [bacterium]|nr:decarboxylating 6-phosphogluconate dehydrogenase [bacterium]
MELGFIGLGRMGMNIAHNLLSKGVRVVAYNRSPGPVSSIASKGAVAAGSPLDLARKLQGPRTIWIMVTAGEAVDAVIESLLPFISKDDTIIDGGNSYYKDSIRRAEKLAGKGINFLDCGTSGGLEGAAHGACLTVGGPHAVFQKHEELFRLIATGEGYTYMGESGAGHFVKMVHNGIEYALLQSYAEGFQLMRGAPFDLDLHEAARVWNRGSVIRSWLLELAEKMFAKDPHLEKIGGEVGGGETGAWSVETAIELKAPFAMLAQALSARYDSKTNESFANRFVAGMRNEFGGHEIKEK